MNITNTPRWSLGRGKTVVPSRWQATGSTISRQLGDEVAELAGMPTDITKTRLSQRPRCRELTIVSLL